MFEFDVQCVVERIDIVLDIFVVGDYYFVIYNFEIFKVEFLCQVVEFMLDILKVLWEI